MMKMSVQKDAIKSGQCVINNSSGGITLQLDEFIMNSNLLLPFLRAGEPSIGNPIMIKEKVVISNNTLMLIILLITTNVVGYTRARKSYSREYNNQLMKLEPKISINDLGTLKGHKMHGSSINRQSIVAGDILDARGHRRACIWSSSQIKIIAESNQYGDSTAVAINNQGDITGYSVDKSRTVPFIIKRNILIQLGKQAEISSFVPYGINDDGTIIGTANTKKRLSHAFIWKNNQLIDLGTLGGDTSEPTAISNSGLIVGDAQLPRNAARHAFLWKHGFMNDLGVLAGDVSSVAWAVNDNGQIVGSSVTSRNVTRAFLYEKGKMHSLESPNGCKLCMPWGLNNHGQIVGYYMLNKKSHACIWDHGHLFEIFDPQNRFVFRIARAINDRGDILCWGKAIHEKSGRSFIVHWIRRKSDGFGIDPSSRKIITTG